MRSIVFALLATAMLAAALPATGRAQDIQWGVKGGLNVSGLRGYDGAFDTKRGVVAGGFGVFDFAPEFGIEVDALFMMKGGKTRRFWVDQTGAVVVPIDEGFFILDYLEFPILARLNAPAMGRVSPHVYFGPTVALKLSARTRDFGFPSGNLDGARTLDSGLAFGVSGDLPLGSRTFVLDARFGIGLTNALSWLGPDLKNDTFSLMAGIAF